MCNKVDLRIECIQCDYPYAEAMYSDRVDDPFPCDTHKKVLREWVDELLSRAEDDDYDTF